MSDPTLFDVAVAREEAIQRVEANADDAWLETAYNAILTLAATRTHLTTDDVWALLAGVDASTHEPRALGAVMRRAQRDRLIQPTADYQVSQRPTCHGRPLRVWRSLIARERVA